MKRIDRREFINTSARAAAVAAFSSMFLAACKDKKSAAYKLGVCDWDFGKSGNPAAFDSAKEAGLDGLLVSSKAKTPSEQVFFSAEQIAQYKTKMAETALATACTSPTCLNMKPFWSDPDAVSFAKKSIDAAALLGCHDVLLPFYGPARMDTKVYGKLRDEIYPELVRRLREIAPYAAQKNVVVSMENSVCADDNKRVIDAVGSEFIKVYFDIFNYEFYGMKTVPELKKLKGYVGQMHLKDKGFYLDSNSGMPESMQACFDTIKEIGYKGWLVFELHGFKEGRDGSAVDVIRHNADFVRKSSLFA